MADFPCPHCGKSISKEEVNRFFAKQGGQANAKKNLEKLRAQAKAAAHARWNK